MESLTEKSNQSNREKHIF